MRREDGTWDVRCPGDLIRLRAKLMTLPNGKPRPYYWKIDRKVALNIVRMLSRAYRVRPCRVAKSSPPSTRSDPLNGLYDSSPSDGGRPMMWVHGRAHMKTVFHEFYHHLEAMRPEEYDSNDRNGGPSSLGWQFADRLWAVLTTAPIKGQATRYLVRKDRISVYIKYDGKRLRPATLSSKLYHPGSSVHAMVRTTGSGLSATVTPWHVHTQNAAGGSETWVTGRPTLIRTKQTEVTLKKREKARLDRHLVALQHFIARAKTAAPADVVPLRFEFQRLLITTKSFGPLPEVDMTALNKMTQKAQSAAKSAGKRSKRNVKAAPEVKAQPAPAPKDGKKQAPKPAPKNGVTKPGKPKLDPNWRKLELKDSMKLVPVLENPYRGDRRNRWKYGPKGGTVADLSEKGMRPADMRFDVGHGYVKVVK